MALADDERQPNRSNLIYEHSSATANSKTQNCQPTSPDPSSVFIITTSDMAESRFQSERYMSEAFVESAGVILFRLSSKEVCVLHLLKGDEYVLPKGRRNCGESRQTAALRELTEETGFSGHILPLNMHTRAPPAVETEQLDDRARFYKGISEPFTLQIRQLSENEVKLIWWFVAAVDDNIPPIETLEKERYAGEFFSYSEVLDRLTFREDREMVKRAIEAVEKTYE